MKLDKTVTVLTLKEACTEYALRSLVDRFQIKMHAVTRLLALHVQDEPHAQWAIIKQISPQYILLGPSVAQEFLAYLQEQNLRIPVILDVSNEDAIEEIEPLLENELVVGTTTTSSFLVPALEL